MAQRRGPTISGTRDRLENADRLSRNHDARIIFHRADFFKIRLVGSVSEFVSAPASRLIEIRRKSDRILTGLSYQHCNHDRVGRQVIANANSSELRISLDAARLCKML